MTGFCHFRFLNWFIYPVTRSLRFWISCCISLIDFFRPLNSSLEYFCRSILLNLTVSSDNRSYRSDKLSSWKFWGITWGISTIMIIFFLMTKLRWRNHKESPDIKKTEQMFGWKSFWSGFAFIVFDSIPCKGLIDYSSGFGWTWMDLTD